MFSLSFEPQFKQSVIDADLDNFFEEYSHDLADFLCDAGEKFKNKAKAKTKSEGGFGNITFNLRSSIGYLVGINGEEYKASFTAVSGGSEGVKAGKEFARELLAEKGKVGVTLFYVAGIEYAVYVENKANGIEVIEGSYFLLKDQLNKDLGS